MIRKMLISLGLSTVVLSTSLLACPKGHDGKGCGYEKSTSSKIVTAVSKTGLSAAQTKKIAEGIAEYEATIVKVKKMQIFPVDSFVGIEFDEKRFVAEMSEKYIAAVAARAALYKFVFAVLNEEQRKIFKREYAAPLISQIIKSY